MNPTYSHSLTPETPGRQTSTHTYPTYPPPAIVPLKRLPSKNVSTAQLSKRLQILHETIQIHKLYIQTLVKQHQAIHAIYTERLNEWYKSDEARAITTTKTKTHSQDAQSIQKDIRASIAAILATLPPNEKQEFLNSINQKDKEK